jgi:hypothetical protein
MHTNTLTTALTLFLALPLLTASSFAQDNQLPVAPDGECIGARLEKRSAFRSFGQIASDGTDQAANGKILELEMAELPDIGYTELSVRGAPKGMPSIIIVGAAQSETRLPWGDTLVVGDIVGAFMLPGDTSSMLIDLDSLDRPRNGSLKIYVQAFSFDAHLPFPLTSSNGVEISLSQEEVIDYYGPEITSSVLSTDSIVPFWSITIRANVHSYTHAMSLDSITRKADVTRIYVSLNTLDTAYEGGQYMPLVVNDSAKLQVELGADVGELIEIWVSEGGHHKDGSPCYALAHATLRKL